MKSQVHNSINPQSSPKLTDEIIYVIGEKESELCVNIIEIFTKRDLWSYQMYLNTIIDTTSIINFEFKYFIRDKNIQTWKRPL